MDVVGFPAAFALRTPAVNTVQSRPWAGSAMRMEPDHDEASTRAEGATTPGRHAASAPLVPAALVICGLTLVASVLVPALHANRAQSFDALLYARAAWGVAHGDPFNPVAGVSSFAVHLHGGLVLIAPLTRALGGLTALIVAQGLAFGATLALVHAAVARTWAASGRPLRVGGNVALALAVLGGCLVSTWVANPFLYDVRPDLIGIPFATAALLRLATRHRADTGTLLLAALAVCMREELALPLAAGFVVAPGVQREWGRRAAGIALTAGVWVVYVLWGRTWFGGAVATERIEGTVDVFLGVPPEAWGPAFLHLLPNRLAVAGGAALTGCGLAAFGGRWWLAAAPGLAWVLVALRQPDEALHFHYPMVAAPALLTASVVGLRRVLSWRRPAIQFAAGGAGIVAAVCFALVWSSWPFGGRFAAERYRASEGPQGAAVERSHALLAAALEGQTSGAVVPWSFGAPWADRSVVWSNLQLVDALAKDAPIPPAIEQIALIRSDAEGVRAVLVERHGFRVVTPPGEPLVVFRRSVGGAQ